ncbi:MAG: aldose epimerase family protein [Eubacterium sp.]|nr:aldose epimerase family protein [Eubacterium sp.]
MERVQDFGKTKAGQQAHLYTIGHGYLKAQVTDYGAALVSYTIDTGKGPTDVVLGYDDVSGYETNAICAVGAIVGRNANRIGNAYFSLNGKPYHLVANDGINNLHSGPEYYFTRFYKTKGVDADGNSITFTLFSPDGDQGFPGRLTMKVTYSITDREGLTIHYEAVCDKDTVFNPTCHAYFNLDGEGNGDVTDQFLQIFAAEYTPVDKNLIPYTGFLREARGTSFDFQEMKRIGADLDDPSSKQQKYAKGYDMNFAVAHHKRSRPYLSAYASSPDSGLEMEVYTELPGIQFYTANFLDVNGKGGKHYGPRSAFCLETQFYPNAINDPEFPKPILRAGEKYESTTIYKLFSSDMKSDF